MRVKSWGEHPIYTARSPISTKTPAPHPVLGPNFTFMYAPLLLATIFYSLWEFVCVCVASLMREERERELWSLDHPRETLLSTHNADDIPPHHHPDRRPGRRPPLLLAHKPHRRTPLDTMHVQVCCGKCSRYKSGAQDMRHEPHGLPAGKSETIVRWGVDKKNLHRQRIPNVESFWKFVSIYTAPGSVLCPVLFCK